jgi:hypothetical protein
MTPRALAVLAVLAVLGGGGAAACGPAVGLGPAGDVPVPPTAARATVHLMLDLAPVHGCERAFDLALYRDRGVDLVEWDRQPGACAGRRVVIRYLSARTDRAAVIAKARGLAARVEILEPEGRP